MSYSAGKLIDVSATGVLLLSCPDQRGVVAAVAEFIAAHGGNIVHAELVQRHNIV